MNRRDILKSAALLGMALPAAAATAAQTAPHIALPAAQTDGGLPLMQALARRRSWRQFSARKLPPQVLSNLLWAAFGVNRPESGMRTAPSAHNAQEIELYLAMEEGLYFYEHQRHALQPLKALDLRARTGFQAFAADAPLNLIFVADLARVGGASDDHMPYAAADTGYISQNVYLYCASEGLATVARGWVERNSLAKAIGLKSDHRIILAQSVGYPAA
jgi:SagB-type dehydrogenase family enzyme